MNVIFLPFPSAFSAFAFKVLRGRVFALAGTSTKKLLFVNKIGNFLLESEYTACYSQMENN